MNGVYQSKSHIIKDLHSHLVNIKIKTNIFFLLYRFPAFSRAEFGKNMAPPPMQVEEHDEEQNLNSNEKTEDSEFGPLLISKLEVIISWW